MDLLELTQDDHNLLESAKSLLIERFELKHHHVASAALTSTGKIVKGLHVGTRRVNVCAEQVAIGSASTLGHDVVAIASAIMMTEDDIPEATSPCGICREVLVYHNPDMRVVVRMKDVAVCSARELLPAPWLLPKELSRDEPDGGS